MEELSPEAKSLYEMLMAETREEYESLFMAHKKIFDARVKASSTTSPTAPLSVPCATAPNSSSSASPSPAPPCVPSSAVSTGGISEPAAATSTPASAQDVMRAHSTSAHPGVENFRPRGAFPTRLAATSLHTATSVRVSAAAQLDSTSTIVPAATAMHETADLRSVPPTTCSTVCLGGNMSATATPASPTTVSTMLPSPAEIEDVHDAVDLGVADLAASTPTTCSAECPSVYAAALILSATPNSSSTTGGIVPELAAPELSDKALDVDATGDTAPLATIYLSGGLDNSTGREDTVPMSLTPSVPPSCNAPLEGLPCPLTAPTGVLELFMLCPFHCSIDCSDHNFELPSRLLPKTCTEFNVPTPTEFVPWPPRNCTRARSPLPLWYVKASQQKWNANFLKVREDSHPNESIKVVKLKPPWPPSLDIVLRYLTWEKSIAKYWCSALSFLHPSENQWEYQGSQQCPIGGILVEVISSKEGAVLCFSGKYIRVPSFQFGIAGNVSIYGSSDFQWYIAWSHTLAGATVCTIHLARPIISLLTTEALASDPSVAIRLITVWIINDYTEPVLCLINKLFSSSPNLKWPPMSLIGPFLISAVVHPEFIGMYSVTAVLSRLFIVVLMRTEGMFRLFFQFAKGDINLLLTFVPGLPLSGMHTMFSTLVDGIAIRLRSSSEVTCLQEHSLQELFSCSFVVEQGMLALEELKPWTIWERPLLVTTVYHHPPSAKPPDKLARIQWNILIANYLCNCSWLVHSGNLFEFRPSWPHVLGMCLNLSLISLCTAGVSWSLSRGNSFHEPKPPWSLSDTTRSHLMTVVESMDITGISWELYQFGVAASYGSKSKSCFDFERKMMGDQIVTEGATHLCCQLFEWPIPCWEVTSTIDSLLAIKQIPGMFTLALQYSEVANYLAVTVLLLSNHLSEVWVLYLHVTYISKCAYKLMTWEIARSDVDSLTCSKRMLISWDPGGSSPGLAVTTDSNWKSTRLQFLYLTWDPGGYTQHRLEGKPNFKEGGLSTTCLHKLASGPPPWALACLGARREAYIAAERPQSGAAWTERTGRRLRPRLAGVCVACAVVLLPLPA